MRKRFFKSVLSLVLALCMIMPSSLLTAQAAEDVVYEYENVTVTNPVANSWYETTETSGDGPAAWAFDDNSSTHWHSNWGEAATGNPHASAFTWATVSTIPAFSEISSNREWIGGEFGRAIDFAKMEYTGRTGKNTNWYGQYALYLANVTGREVTDADFQLAASGTNGGFSKVTITLETPKKATHFRFVAFTANPTGNNFVTASEIDVFEGIAADTTPAFGGAIVDNDTQWTQDRFSEVKRLTETSAELSAWKNDKATSEIALYAANAAYDNVTVTAGDLSDGNGNAISSENVTTTFIKSTKAYNGGYLGYGSPDREIPADNGTNRSESSDILWTNEPVDMSANSVQPVWVEIAIPEDTEAGVYTGTISATADGVADALEFTYTVEVYDAVLADAEDYSFNIMQWQYPYSSAEYYGVEPFSDAHLDILRDIMSIYKEVGGKAITTTFTEEAWAGQTYSANPVHYPSMVKWTQNTDGSFTYDYTHFDKWVSLCKEMGLGDKIVAYGIAPWHGSFTYWTAGASAYTKETYSVGDARYVAVWTDFLTDFAEHLEEKGWKDQVYIGIDERGVNAAAFDVAEAAGLKTAADIDNINNHWAIAQRVTDLNVGDTAAYNLSTQFAELKKIRDAKGFTTTLYSCTEHRPGNFSLSAPVESYWTVLNAGMMEADGFNRWAYDAWVADPLNDATHNSFEPGDCFVIYPDEKTAENPETKYSVRLARMAEGIRDVNKLAIMESEMPALSGDVDDVYDNIQFALKTSRSYLSNSEIAELADEADEFKADLDTLTEKYIALKNGGTYEVESVTIDEGDALTIEFGSTETLHTTMAPENLINTNVVWTSSNSVVVSVNEDGEIEGLQPGTATITAASEEDETKFDSIVITVEVASVDESKQVAYYSFDNVEGTALVDEWGTHNGTIKASATTVAGKSGNALSVTAEGEGAVVEDYANLDAGNWTVSYWVNHSTNLDKEISVLEDSTQTYSLSLRLGANSNRNAPGFRVGNNDGDVLSYQNCTFTKGTWYHLTWVQDKATGLTLYVNGVRADSNTWTVGKTMNVPSEVIGGTGFTGLIDEVKVFNTALTEKEISSLMLINGINNFTGPVEIYLDETHQLNPYVISDKADKTITFESADPAIATVDENGLITAVGRGTTTITAKNEAGGYEAEITVKVSVEISIINQIPRYVLPEEYQSDVDGPYRESGAARRYLGQPDMVQTETGRLITVFPTGHGHGPLVMKISDNNGETWVEKTDIPSSWAASQETPTIYSLQVDDGNGGTFERLVLVCACPQWDLNLGGWQMSYSDDNGDTWTQFEDFWQEVDGNKHWTIVAMASLVQLKDEDGNWKQEWMGVYHDYSYINYKSILTFDEEGNPQWSKPEAYLSEYRAIESSHQICEVGMFRSPDGNRIVALGRNQTHSGPATMFYSDDEGKTWTEPVELPGSLAGERHKALYDPISGKLLITFREIIYDRNGNGVWEGGSDWICGEWVAWVGDYEDLMNLQQGDYKIILDEDFSGNYYSGDTGYTGMAVLEDGTFVLHSYGHWDPSSASNSDVRTDLCWIRQAKFKLTDLNFEEEGEEIELEEIPTAAMTITTGNEESTYATSDEGYIRYALDGDTNTKWHTDWYPAAGNTHETHWIQLALDDVYGVAGFKYLPRQDSSTNGDITGYEIQISMDGEEWETVAEGTWAADKSWKEVTFDVQNAQYVRLQVTSALSNQDNKKFASAAEVRVLGGDAIETPEPEEPTPDVPEIPDGEVCKIFVDVEHDAWYEGSVQYVYDEGIIIGDGNVFAPNDATTRAMVAVILYRLAGSPEVTDYTEYNKFTDLPAEHLWYSDAVAWALKEKVSTGDDANMLYNPTSPVTREQLSLFLWRYAKYTGEDVTVNATEEELFGGTYVNSWAKEGFAWAVENGIIKGAETTDGAGNTYYDLNPQGGATRAQFARVLHRYIGGATD